MVGVGGNENNDMNVLVSGANGFVGKAVCEHLIGLGFNVKGTVRGEPMTSYQVASPALSENANWAKSLQGMDVIVHCAARVHVMSERDTDPLSAFRAVNTLGTLNLARQAAKSGVKRFIFISTIKVNGKATEPGKPFTEQIVFSPLDPYGRSKYEAELGLLALAKESQMEVTIIRPPLIYGAGVKANFASMMKWVQKGIPLPFARIHNARSLLGLPNLCDFVARVLTHPGAANQVFLVADPKPYSTSTLLCEIALAHGKSARLFYIPPTIIRFFGKACGLDARLQRLFGSLEMDTRKAQRQLQWHAPHTITETLSSMGLSHIESC